MAHRDSWANHFLNDLISAVDQRSYNPPETHLKRSIAI